MKRHQGADNPLSDGEEKHIEAPIDAADMLSDMAQILLRSCLRRAVEDACYVQGLRRRNNDTVRPLKDQTTQRACALSLYQHYVISRPATNFTESELKAFNGLSLYHATICHTRVERRVATMPIRLSSKSDVFGSGLIWWVPKL